MSEYAKIIDGVFTPAPRKIQREIDGVQYVTYNPTGEMLVEQGWLPVRYTDPPDDAPEGYHYEDSLAEGDGEIVQDWTLAEDPDPAEEEVSPDEAMEYLFGGVD